MILAEPLRVPPYLLPYHRRVEPQRGFHRSDRVMYRPDGFGGTASRSALPAAVLS